MNNDFVSIRGKSLPRRMVLQGIASLLGGAFAPSAFAATADSCQLTEREILGPFIDSARRSRPNWLGQTSLANGLLSMARCTAPTAVPVCPTR